MLRGLRTVVFWVEELGRARDWYARALGHGPYYDTPYYVGFDVGGYELGLHPMSEGDASGVGGEIPYWEVEDVDAAMARLVELGATVHGEAHDVGEGIRLGAVVDPFGNVVGVIRNPHFRGGVGAGVAASGAELSDRAVVHEAEVALPVSEVWRRWTTEQGMAEWLVERSRIELRVGGPFELYFLADAPPGSRGGEGCVFLSFLPERLLSFTWNAPPGMKTRKKHTWVVVELEPRGEGTFVRLTHTGWPAAGLEDPGSEWPATFEYFEAAWGRVMQALVRSGRGG